MTLEAGTRLGHYRIVGLLGRGGMADVYRAEDERLGREVALKAVPPEFARDADRVERFEREVRAAAKLTHANIVTVHEFGQGAGQHFYTMALMPGGDLKVRIRGHPDGMPPAEARSVAASVARALDYAHRHGFVHRDVKPENILFDADGTPQLTDFGIARAMSSGTRMTATGMSIGSPHYMSPEQARGKEVDGRSDLYSLGVVLYEMLTGRAPFEAAETFAVAYAHINDPAPQLPPTLAELQPVMDRLLAKSPQDRYSTAADLAEVLAPGSQPRPSATRVMTPGRAAGAPAPAREPAAHLAAANSRQTRLMAVAGGVLLAVVAVGVGYVAQQGGDGVDREPSSGARGSAAVEAAPVQPEPSTDFTNPFAVDDSGAAPGPDPANAIDAVNGEETASDDGGADAEARVTAPAPQPSPPPVPQPTAPPPAPAPAAEPVLGGGAVLVVETTPPGVEVRVDGQLVGETPLERTDIRSGVREVTLRHAYYEAESIAGNEFEDGVVLRLERVLRRGVGRLTVTATPREAWIEVDGQRVAERTPVTLEDLPAGRVELTLGAAEHRVETVAVDVPKDGLGRLERTLARYRTGETQVFDGMEFVWIPAGEFRMGSTSAEADDDEQPVRTVRIGEGFWLGKHEVTQSEWQREMGSNPSRFDECGPTCPVEQVSWDDAQEFIGRLNARGGGNRYRLPSEAEWEYAARAGTTGDRYGNVDAIGWYRDNSRSSPHPVGQKGPNGWGLHDMLGNVWEWVEDCWHDSYRGAPTDGTAWTTGGNCRRVLRGGSWDLNPRNLRAANRGRFGDGDRSNLVGFRVARTLD